MPIFISIYPILPGIFEFEVNVPDLNNTLYSAMEAVFDIAYGIVQWELSL